MSNKQQQNQPSIPPKDVTNIEDLINGLDIKGLVELMYISETAERYEDLRKLCKKMVLMKFEKEESNLELDQRNLLQVAYSKVVGAKQASWRQLNNDIDRDDEIKNKYKKIVAKEVEIVCMELLDLLTKYLCKNNIDGGESEIYYLKLTADHYRYLAEIKLDIDINKKYDQLSEEYYMRAMDLAEKNLSETHPTRLRVALNFSLCCYEILKQPQRAINLSKKAFQDAIYKLDNHSGGYYKDPTLIMQLIADNTVKWTKEQIKKRGIKLINGYMRIIKNEYNHLIIPEEINQILIEYYLYYEEDLKKIMGYN